MRFVGVRRGERQPRRFTAVTDAKQRPGFQAPYNNGSQERMETVVARLEASEKRL